MTDNIQAVIDTAIASAEPDALTTGTIYAYNLGDRIHLVDLTGDEYRDKPTRKTGNVYVEDLDSFTHYYNKHADADTEIYVDVAKHRITAVLDAHTGPDGARWQQHRLILQMATADRWNDWARNNGQNLGQYAFAEYIEEHLDDIREPAAATMLEIAQTFQAATKVKFSSAVTLSNGDRRLNWEETTDASAGNGGKLQVPSVFTIGIAPFDWCQPYAVNARLRYRIQNGQLLISYLLDDPKAVIKDAVLDIVNQLEEQLKVKVMRGTPIGTTA